MLKSSIQNIVCLMIRLHSIDVVLAISTCLIFGGCSPIKIPQRIAEEAFRASYYVLKGSYELPVGTTRLVYKVGEYTFKVLKAPIEWAFMNEDIEDIDGMAPKEAVRKGRVKTAPYTVKGKRYYPMSVEKAKAYHETGTASWYGYETLRQNKGKMTANGEVFDPKQFTAAHKLLPLPTHVKVTNLENGRAIIVRVNDRGPFPSDYNPSSGERVIDLSAGAAKRLGFHEKGLARVKVEAIELRKES